MWVAKGVGENSRTTVTDLQAASSSTGCCNDCSLLSPSKCTACSRLSGKITRSGLWKLLVAAVDDDDFGEGIWSEGVFRVWKGVGCLGFRRELGIIDV